MLDLYRVTLSAQPDHRNQLAEGAGSSVSLPQIEGAGRSICRRSHSIILSSNSAAAGEVSHIMHWAPRAEVSISARTEGGAAVCGKIGKEIGALPVRNAWHVDSSNPSRKRSNDSLSAGAAPGRVFLTETGARPAIDRVLFHGLVIAGYPFNNLVTPLPELVISWLQLCMTESARRMTCLFYLNHSPGDLKPQLASCSSAMMTGPASSVEMMGE